MEMKGNKKSLKDSKNSAPGFILNIIVNEDGCVHGRIQHCESGEVKNFRSLIEMILLIHGRLDQMQFPQPTNQIRSWVIQTVPAKYKLAGHNPMAGWKRGRGIEANY
ncbi:MAG TPA: hypothetical protein VIK72_00425 [Clostridiaceae bacterium]